MAGQARPECDRGKRPDPKPASGRHRRAQLAHGTRHPASGAASSAGPRGSRAPRRPLSVSPGSRVNKGACPRGATPVPLSPPVPRPAIPAITTHCHRRPRQTGIRSSALRRAGGDRKMRGGKKKRNDGQTLWYDQLLSDSENNPRLSVSLIRRPRENGGINVRVAAGRCAKPLVPRLPTPTGDSSGWAGSSQPARALCPPHAPLRTASLKRATVSQADFRLQRRTPEKPSSHHARLGGAGEADLRTEAPENSFLSSGKMTH